MEVFKTDDMVVARNKTLRNRSILSEVEFLPEFNHDKVSVLEHQPKYN